MAYVYRHIRLDKNEPFYIGIGNDENYSRANSIKNRNRYWNSIYNKTRIEIDILISNLTWDIACEKEKEFISIYGRKDLGTGTLVNLTLGGEGKIGAIISKETREKLSIAGKGRKRPKEVIEKIRLKNIGKKRSKETIKKLSESHKGIRIFGHKQSEETKKKISDFHKNRKRNPMSIETKLKIGAANKLKNHYLISEETKKKLSESMKKYWENKKMGI